MIKELVHIHVTVLSTTAPYANATYFGLPEGTKVPRVLLTARDGVTLSQTDAPEPEFNSLSYASRMVRDGEWAVKIFSNARLSDEWLDNMFLGQVKWVHRKEVRLL